MLNRATGAGRDAGEDIVGKMKTEGPMPGRWEGPLLGIREMEMEQTDDNEIRSRDLKGESSQPGERYRNPELHQVMSIWTKPSTNGVPLLTVVYRPLPRKVTCCPSLYPQTNYSFLIMVSNLPELMEVGPVASLGNLVNGLRRFWSPSTL